MANSISGALLEKIIRKTRTENPDIDKCLKKLEAVIAQQHVYDFLSMTISYLVIDAKNYNKENEFYEWLVPKLSWRATADKKTKEHYSLVYFIKTNQRGWRVYTLRLVKELCSLFELLERLKTPDWRKLPASLYRALECYMMPESWSRLPNFQRCETTLPKELYAILHLGLYQSARQRHTEKTNSKKDEDAQTQKVVAATAAAYTLLKIKHREPCSVRYAYSALRLCLETGNSNYSSDLAHEIQERREDSDFSRLCRALRDFYALIQSDQKNKSSRYYLRDVDITDAAAAATINLPHEHAEVEKLRQKLNSRIRQLRFDASKCSMLTLHITMSCLRSSYPSSHCTDYCVYCSDSSVYLVLSKDYHKFIVNTVLPNMRINGHFRKDVLPVFPQVAEGLISGDSNTLRYCLQSVYDMIIGWASKQSYFRKVHDIGTLRASVVLLCRYAGCFNSPEELAAELRMPYINVNRHYECFELSSDGSTLSAMEAVYCPQETIKAIIMLQESHYIHLRELEKLYHTVCVEKKGQQSVHYSSVYKWARQLYRGRESYRRSLAVKVGGKSPRNDWMHVYMCLETFYSYFTDGCCFGSAEARYYCDRLLVHADRRNRFRTPVPTQSPGLPMSKKTVKLYNAAMKRTRRRKEPIPYSQLCGTHLENLCELLKQVECLRMHSNVIDSNTLYRAYYTAADYATSLHAARLVCEKLRSPPFMHKGSSMKSCKQLFPVRGSNYYAPEIPDRLLHTTEPELLAYVLYAPLPTAACVDSRKRKQ